MSNRKATWAYFSAYLSLRKRNFMLKSFNVWSTSVRRLCTHMHVCSIMSGTIQSLSVRVKRDIMMDICTKPRLCPHTSKQTYAVSSHLVTFDCFCCLKVQSNKGTPQHNVSYAVSKHLHWDHSRYGLIQPGKSPQRETWQEAFFILDTHLLCV